ncbi:MAG: T9SS type A sorting domain-containing protein [Bacteroidetes bacterium]|nr:T9SS type A sorting domain-containing protein [Bacteroidota bacterium]MBK9544218.1 T9SS type A sorting domain-containing protein [Bacteroidota bacterium]
MKNVIVVCIFILGIIKNNSAQSFFQRSYEGIHGAAGFSVKQTSDGGYIIFGNSAGFGANTCYYLVRLDQNGDTMWTRAYCDSYYDYALSLAQAYDGGFVMTGYSSIISNEIVLLKSDSSGTLLWSKKFEGAGNDIPYTVKETLDSGYVICGYTESFGHGNRDLLVIKVNSIGDTVWTKVYGGSMNEVGRSIEQTVDSGFIITGYGFGNSNGFYVLKLDPFGNILWSKTYLGNGNYDARKCLTTLDGGYIIAGTTSVTSINNIFLIKTDSFGDTLWSKTYGGADYYWGESISQTTDSGFVVTGEMLDSLGTTYAFYLMKVDLQGNVRWNNTFNIVGGGVSNDVKCTTDEGFIICGGAHILDTISDKIYFIKTDSTGLTGCHENFRAIESGNNQLSVGVILWNNSNANFFISNPAFTTYSGGTQETICSFSTIIENKPLGEFAIFPNPAHDIVTIQAISFANFYTVEIINSIGEVILERNIELTYSMDFSNFPKGIYFIRFTSNTRTETRKIILL